MYKPLILSAFLLCTGNQMSGMQTRLPYEIQEEVEARDFINRIIDAKASDREQVVSEALGFFKLMPRFTKNQAFVDTLIEVYNKRFHLQDLAQALAKNNIEPAKQWLKDYQLGDSIMKLNNEKKIENLLQEGARVNMPIDGEYPLEIAAKKKNNQVLALLLKHGANASAANDFGTTALMSAARNANLQGVKMLLAHKANPAAVDADKNSALHLAVYAAKGSPQSNNVAELTNNIIGIITELLAAGAPINSRNNAQRTPLHIANSLLIVNQPYPPVRNAYKSVLEPVISLLKKNGAKV